MQRKGVYKFMEIKKVRWESCYMGKEHATIVPIKAEPILEDICYSYNLFAKVLNHKCRMFYQKFFKKLHIKFPKHSRKKIRRKR